MIEHNGTTCPCHCHDGPAGYYACSEVGGCGTTWQDQPDLIVVITSQPTTPKYDLKAHTIDGEQACILGCKDRGEHQAHCPCQDTCPEHEGHCTGCAPKPTHAGSLLCGRCFAVKLRRPLRRVPALWDWLSSRKGGLKAQAYDDDRVSSSKEAPLPFNPGIVDHLSLMSLLLNAWCSHAVRRADPGPGPCAWDAVGSAEWLDEHAGWIAEQEWMPDLLGHLRELENRARHLAPWQAMRHALPLPCLKCEEQTLVLFGGEDWVTCTNPECDEIIGWYRYTRLSRAVAGVREQDVG